MLDCDASDVKELADWTDGWCVSAFLPAHEVTGRERGDVLHLKNLLRTAEEDLVAVGLRPTQAARMLAGMIPEDLADPTSGAFHRAGVALFAADDLRRAYRLLGDNPPLVTVARRFHLKPLLLMLRNHIRFAVLAVTRGYARCYAGNSSGLRAIEVPELPTSLDDAVRYDDREPGLFSHSASRNGAGVVAAFHGQGGRNDHLAEDMMRYLRRIDTAMSRSLDPTTPLVVVGSRDVVARYRRLSQHGNLLEHDVLGNPEVMAADDLHASAWGKVEAAMQRSMETAVGRFHQLHGTGKASGTPDEVIQAARDGRVETLIVAADAQLWGRYGGDTQRPEVHAVRMPGDEDLLDTAAVDAWSAGAEVHVVLSPHVPGESEIAAVFRY